MPKLAERIATLSDKEQEVLENVLFNIMDGFRDAGVLGELDEDNNKHLLPGLWALGLMVDKEDLGL